MIDSCYIGDVRDGLRAFIAAGVKAQTCITSPPYWGLRDYGMAGQLGLEPTPAEYVAAMVEVFALVRDVLADDGTLWLNIGDSYAAQRGGTTPPAETLAGGICGRGDGDALRGRKGGYDPSRDVRAFGLKHKDLVGIPWRLAFALQADGWYLRSDIIWHKPNPMPESVTDRPTKAHEYLFLLAKSERYYMNMAAIRERSLATNDHDQTGGAMCGLVPGANPQSGTRKSKMPDGWATHAGSHRSFHKDGREKGAAGEIDYTRNKRSVWTVPTEAFSEAHFATFPQALVEPCVLSGSRVGDIVLDPFMGSGTTAQVAQRLGRHWIGCELSPEYAKLIERRAAQQGMAFA